MKQIEYKTVYTPLPSAFQLIDAPIHFMHERTRSAQDNLGPRKDIKFLTGWLAGFPVYCIAVCATPVTIVADMVIGVTECAFCALKGLPSSDIASLAKKKILVAPLHQMIFLIHAIGLGILFCPCVAWQRFRLIPNREEVIGAIATYIFLGWPLMYQFTQFYISNLSPEWNHRQFNIFYQTGARFGHFGKPLSDDYENLYSQYQNERSTQTTSTKWQEFVQKETESTSRLLDPEQSEDYNTFKTFILRGSAPESFLIDPNTNEFSKKRYLEWARVTHPDKNPNHHVEAEHLFRCLQEARAQLDPS